MTDREKYLTREVERVAGEINRIYLENEEPYEAFRALARWHLREVRRARGRTVGYGVLPPPLSHWTRKPYFKMGVWTRKAYSGNNARVVVDPKRRRK